MQALRLVKTTQISREDWLTHRCHGIGGSDISAIAGLNPWRSPMQVYLEKIGAIPGAEENEAMHFGRIFEAVVANEFARRNKLKVQRVNAILQHPKYPAFLANIDRLVKVKGNAVLEIKTTSAYGAKDWEDGRAPDWAMLQLQWYLFITGLKHGFLAALIGGQKYAQVEVDRDDEIIGYLQHIALNFWKLVESRTPPEMDGSESSSEVLSLLYPKAALGTSIMLPPDAKKYILEYEAAQAEEKIVAERKEAAANQLKALLGENETGMVDERKVSWRTVVSNRLDSKALKKDLPDIYEKYAKENVSRRFAIK